MIISNTSPLNYLLLIGSENVLPALFRVVHIPEAVIKELSHPSTDSVVRDWVRKLPDWVVVLDCDRQDAREFESIDYGEVMAISLAMQRDGKLILMDDRDGRRVAKGLGFDVMGTLGILEAAAGQGLIEFESIVHRLLQTGFWASAEVIQSIRSRQSKAHP